MGTAALRKSSLDRVVYSSSSFRQRPCAFTTRHRVAGDKTCSDLKNSTTFVLLRTGQCLKRQPRCRRLSMPVTVIRFSRPDRLIAPPDPRAYRPLAIELPQNGLVFRVFQPVVVRAAVNASLFCGFGGLAGHRKKLQESRFFFSVEFCVSVPRDDGPWRPCYFMVLLQGRKEALCVLSSLAMWALCQPRCVLGILIVG